MVFASNSTPIVIFHFDLFGVTVSPRGRGFWNTHLLMYR